MTEMIADSTEGPLTIEEYARMDEPDGFRTELVRGRVVKEPLPGAPHGRTQVRLGRRLDRFVEDEELGRVYADVGVVIDRDAKTVRGPDLAFVSIDRLPEHGPVGFLDVAPDLVVEIVSPSSSVSDIQVKVLEYQEAGCRIVWVVDPSSRSATVYSSRHDVAIVAEDEEVDGGDVLPGLSFRLSEILPEH